MGLRESHAYSQKLRIAHGTLALGDVMLIHDSDLRKTLWWIGKVEGLLEGSNRS